MDEILSREAVVEALMSSIPNAEWLLGQIESEQGWLRFPPYFSNVIANLKLEGYPLLYTNENAIAAVLLKGYLTDIEIQELNTELEAASVDERTQFLMGFCDGLSDLIEKIEIPKTPEEQTRAKQVFDALSPDEQKESVKFASHFYSFFFASFYQNLSIMVHGEKLTSLVAQAIAGNDNAFVKAVQIDRRILTAIPYFQNRFARAQDEADSNFYDYLSYRLKAAPYRGKIRHKTLWLTFAILDQVGLLNKLPHPELLKICDEAGVGGYKNRISDVKNLSKRLAEFREFQRRGVIVAH
jgi:hypothetical protein